MLKALELRGFKSFAEKTRFDFPAGITVVVGPNGSGKSNIVDAIKWVLGEQSAKSLRGKEMSDVIFKGGGSGGRKPANTAEATILFDNSDGKLAIEAPEVHVTRRVYRSGEGEYLVNRQACRLRDVRDLFRGTGVGTDAYSLIEQGKVDTLLQASPRDRRAIFEEAAGISRFKAKKVEAQRRLERVDQNLLRLSDIVDEVENRLRAVRAQAGKARRYRQYTQRLQQLRTQVARVDWSRLTENLSAIESELRQTEEEIRRLSALGEAIEARSLELETELGLASEEQRSREARISRSREQIAGHESAADHQRSRFHDLDQELARHRRQLAAMNTRAGNLENEVHQAQESLETAEGHYQELSQQASSRDQVVEELTGQLNQTRNEVESLRRDYMQRMQTSSELGSHIRADQSQLDAGASAAERLRDTLARLTQQVDEIDPELQSARDNQRQLAEDVDQRAAALDEAQQQLRQSRQQRAAQQDGLAELKGRRAGCRERAGVLEELQQRLDGLSAGVKQVLSLARRDGGGPFSGVRGLIADLIRVSVEFAPMVDVALGDRAQHVVVAGLDWLEHLQSGECRLAGRVGFLQLQSSAPLAEAYRLSPGDDAAVIGRADTFVEVAPEYHHVIRWLLGSTWFVENLSDAIRLSRTTPSAVRYVTRAGELLDTDGRLVAGPRHANVGLVSQRSQLRALQQQLSQLDAQLAEQEQDSRRVGEQIGQQELLVQQLRTQSESASKALSEQRVGAEALAQRRQHLVQQQTATRVEIQEVEQSQVAIAERLKASRDQRDELEASLAESNSHSQKLDQRVADVEKQIQEANHQATAARVELAKSEQRLESLRTQAMQLQRDQDERNRALAETENQLRQCSKRCVMAQRDTLRSTSELAELYLRQEANIRGLDEINQRRGVLQRDRAELGGRIQQLRHQLHDVEEDKHRKQLAASKIEHERETLAQRLREDYQIELGQLEEEPSEEQQQERNAVDAEITDLRRKISNIGAVNLNALEELEELETRFGSLSAQYRDLVDAKESLERIINKINSDSRRLFSQTLDAIRVSFQDLFRKVFGGGRADILLEEGADMLEAGIEIIATPPGKHSLAISLLSGGERALTAVTLLLAIFQYRPSPFCVLDEVDGPLDEANIERFIDVLRGFLDWTKFVVVTHSKKTMTAATTLYGITMQESGVSKRVAVQFEDVTDDGHIRREAIEREQSAAMTRDNDERGAA